MEAEKRMRRQREIQFQTLQFNQHYSSPGSSKRENALKTYKNVIKITLLSPEGQDWFKIVCYTYTITSQCKMYKYINAERERGVDCLLERIRRKKNECVCDDCEWELAKWEDCRNKSGGEERPYLAKGDGDMIKRMERFWKKKKKADKRKRNLL